MIHHTGSLHIKQFRHSKQRHWIFFENTLFFFLIRHPCWQTFGSVRIVRKDWISSWNVVPDSFSEESSSLGLAVWSQTRSFAEFMGYPVLQSFHLCFSLSSLSPHVISSSICLCAREPYLLSAPERSSPEHHPRSQSAVSGQQSSEATGRKCVFNSVHCEAETAVQTQSFISNSTKKLYISKCQTEKQEMWFISEMLHP